MNLISSFSFCKVYFSFTRCCHCIYPVCIPFCKIAILNHILSWVYWWVYCLLLRLCLFQIDIVNHNCVFLCNLFSTYSAHRDTKNSICVRLRFHLKYFFKCLELCCQCCLRLSRIRRPIIIACAVSLQCIHNLSIYC